jgi:hypothetical protein
VGHDSARLAILTELRELRKQYGRLDPRKLSGAVAIVRAFGADDAQVALQRLVDLVTEVSEDRNIQAAMASFGWGVESEAANDRLAEFGLRNHVDARTVRRWSDRGMETLARLIVNGSPWVQPRARQVLRMEGGELKFGLDLYVPALLRMNTPKLTIDGVELDIRMPPIEILDRQQRINSGPALLSLASIEELPKTIELTWLGEKMPTYESLTHGGLEVYYMSRIRLTSVRTRIARFGDSSI